MNRLAIFKLVAVLLLVGFLSACGGGGGGDGGTPTSGGTGPGDGGGSQAGIKIDGQWKVDRKITQSNCGGDGSVESYKIQIAQDGSSISVTMVENTFVTDQLFEEEKLDGSGVSWKEIWDQQNLTKTYSLALTVSSDLKSMSGKTPYSFQDSNGTTCSWVYEYTVTKIEDTGGTGGGGAGGGGTGGGTPSLFQGFDDISLFVGAFWEYSFEGTSSTNGAANSTVSGKTRIELVSAVDVNLTVVGPLKLYKTSYTLTGGPFPGSWTAYEYIGAKDGVLYVGSQLANGQFGAAILFDSHTGKVYKDGFVGYFSDTRKETVTSGNISNKFITAPAVVVDEPFFDPECQKVGDVEVCDDEFHDYQVREYYLPHIGFGGFHRSGTSIFSGGGFIDIFKSTLNVGLTGTNVGN